MAAVRNQVASFLALAAVAVVQYLIVRSHGVTDSWFYLFAAVLFGVMAVTSVLQVMLRGEDTIVRAMDERAAWLQAKAMRYAYSAAILATYFVAFQQALATGEVYNPVTYLFAFMGATWSVAWLAVQWRYR